MESGTNEGLQDAVQNISQNTNNNDIISQNTSCDEVMVMPMDLNLQSCDEINERAMEESCVQLSNISVSKDRELGSDFDGMVASNEASANVTDTESLQISQMLTNLSQTDAHFKSQQRGDPDLTLVEKYKIAHEILSKNPSKFLERFHDYLNLEDLNYFEKFCGNYEIDFYVTHIKQNLNKITSAKIVKNRRYSAMQKLVSEGDYFSEDEMKYRDPLLYEEMVGQYLTSDEIQSRVDKTDLKFSTILLKHIDQLEENKLYHQQKESQEIDQEEYDDKIDEDKPDEDDDESELESDEDEKPKIPEQEKQQLKTEFLEIMQEKFLSGEDTNFFDYSEVDKNNEYDSLATIEQDEQEKYFDED
ncbi:coiled-coil domain-containing protein 97 isoform X2 [Patella vulgata]|nr:coiled-coil domain-containing protein 97 isoform X2 [Patella vulgata]XP_050404644.1 coiled-coil domain-containing protein 97 isoform X2 [Patella vulgata]XP_050404645.1 coiled-coil domain-containing protein 97 isoform X2 [Patella vulgata]